MPKLDEKTVQVLRDAFASGDADRVALAAAAVGLVLVCGEAVVALELPKPAFFEDR